MNQTSIDLKKALDSLLLAKKCSEELLEKREQLHEKMQILREEKRISLSENLEKELAQTKQAIQEMDHHLDEYEKNLQADEEELKKKLILQIAQEDPERGREYKYLEESWKKVRKTKLAYLSLQTTLAPFYLALQEGYSAKKNRGFWSFIFGRHPKIILSRAIRKAEIEAEKIQDRIAFENITKFLTIFLHEAKKNWNHSLYSHRFFQLFEEFQEMVEQVVNKTEENDKEAKKLEKNMNELIETHILRMSQKTHS